MIEKPFELLVATGNIGKARELMELLACQPFVIKTLNDVSVADVVETGKSFAENAALKASEYALQTGMWSLADDSGLEIEALGGAPGVFSARYGGPKTDYGTRMEKLLAEIHNANARRIARFVCAIAVADPEGRIKATSIGICDGQIALAPAGNGGFGYDPIFIPSGFAATFGELSGDIKRQISHRARAYSEILPFLRGLT